GGSVHGEQGETFLEARAGDLVTGRILLDQAVEASDRLLVLPLVVVAEPDPVEGVVRAIGRRKPLEELLEAQLRGGVVPFRVIRIGLIEDLIGRSAGWPVSARSAAAGGGRGRGAGGTGTGCGGRSRAPSGPRGAARGRETDGVQALLQLVDPCPDRSHVVAHLARLALRLRGLGPRLLLTRFDRL